MAPRPSAPDDGSNGPHDEPVRTCVGCGRRDAQSALVPLTLRGDSIEVELARGHARGRGAHVHPRRRCVDDAARRGLARSLRRQVRVQPAELRDRALEAARAASVDALSRAAQGGALVEGGAGLYVVATDARALSAEVGDAVGGGRAICMGTREELGSLLGVEAADWAVVTSEALAGRLRRAAAVHTALAGSEVA